MGAMTQFVPVWSGVRLHSRRLATVQLWLVAGGLVGFVAGLFAGRPGWLVPAGAAMALGFWTFVYNVGRTLARVESFDVTERHFAAALAFFALVPALGLLLAADGAWSLLAALPVSRVGVVRAHATLAVFGAILTTVLGALYQLATMFTQTDLHGVDTHLRRAETVAYPTGVVLLAGGRLFGAGRPAAVGGVLVPVGLLCVAAVVGRRLYETRVPWTPMLSRYAVLVPATACWALATLPVWLRPRGALAARFGAPGTVHLLGLGVVGVVVLGTLYHVVPFVVWVHQYSDRLGYEAVPMIDDLYDDRVARADLALLVAGLVGLVAADAFALPAVGPTAGGLVLLGAALFVANLAWVVHEHGPDTLVGTLVGSPTDESGGPDGDAGPPEDGDSSAKW